jgi:hypothetical protein
MHDYIRKTFLAGALALSSLGIYGGFQYKPAKHIPAETQQQPVTKREQKTLNFDISDTVRKGDGAWHVVKRTIPEAVRQAKERAGKNAQDVHVYIGDVDVTKATNAEINAIVHDLPQRNPEGFYRDGVMPGNGPDYRLWLTDKKGNPSRIQFAPVRTKYTDVTESLETKIVKDAQEIDSYLPQYTLPAAGGAVAFALAYARSKSGGTVSPFWKPNDFTKEYRQKIWDYYGNWKRKRAESLSITTPDVPIVSESVVASPVPDPASVVAPIVFPDAAPVLAPLFVMPEPVDSAPVLTSAAPDVSAVPQSDHDPNWVLTSAPVLNIPPRPPSDGHILPPYVRRYTSDEPGSSFDLKRLHAMNAPFDPSGMYWSGRRLWTVPDRSSQKGVTYGMSTQGHIHPDYINGADMPPPFVSDNPDSC